MSVDLTGGTRPDPEAVRAAARRLHALANALDECADGYERLTDDGWRGPAADAARQAFTAYASPMRPAAQALHTAAGALAAHAAVIDEVLVQLARADAAQDRLDAALAADERARDEEAERQRLASPVHLAPIVVHVDPTVGPLQALVPRLRADAAAMLAESGRVTAAVLTSAATAAPTTRPFAPRTYGQINVMDAVDINGDFNPDYRPVFGYAPTDEEKAEELKARTDSVLDGHVDDALDAAGTMGPAGPWADTAHVLLDAARGEWGDAAGSAFAVIPGVGDLYQAGRIGARTAKVGKKIEHGVETVQDALDTVDDVKEKATAVHDLLCPDEPPQPVGLAGAQVWATAVRRAAGDPRNGALPSESLVQTIMTSPRTRWTIAARTRGGLLTGPRPTAWTASAAVETAGRLVTYELTTDAEGRVTGSPRAVRSRTLPLDDVPRRRIGIDGDRVVTTPVEPRAER